MRRIYALIGLFFPVPTGGGHWGVTLAIGDVPIRLGNCNTCIPS